MPPEGESHLSSDVEPESSRARTRPGALTRMGRTERCANQPTVSAEPLSPSSRRGFRAQLSGLGTMLAE